METKKINLNGKEYLFVNESGSTRHGFYHKSTLFVNDYEEATNKVNYLNRTWECYRYQTAMKGLVSHLKENRYNRLLSDFKKVNNYGRMTDRRRAEFEKVASADILLLEYTELYSKL